jgi:serine protease inhibitor
LSAGALQDTAALLINAVYFKGSWASPFRRELTQTRRFHLESNNSYVDAAFMYREGRVLLGRQTTTHFGSLPLLTF